MREYIVQYERKESDNPKDKCDLCEHAIVGELVRCPECNWHYVKQVTEHLGIHECGLYHHSTTKDFFCGSGKRKGGDDE